MADKKAGGTITVQQIASPSRKPDSQQLRYRGVVLGGRLARLVEVALRQHRLDAVPCTAVPDRETRQRHVAFDRDRSRQGGDEQDRIHEHAASDEEVHD